MARKALLQCDPTKGMVTFPPGRFVQVRVTKYIPTNSQPRNSPIFTWLKPATRYPQISGAPVCRVIFFFAEDAPSGLSKSK